MSRIKDLVDIIPDSEKELFKVEPTPKEEIKTNLDDKIDTVINNTLDRTIHRQLNRTIK